ncbi:AAA family ATPase, partial [Candidatus Nomurabacteria bacterium]|nr:AAA family ATPase [Candidatus Nomurabacteria bacterium]
MNELNLIDRVVVQLMNDHPDQTSFRRKDIINAMDRVGLDRNVGFNRFLKSENKTSHGVYSLSAEVVRLQEYKESHSIIEPEEEEEKLVVHTNNKKNSSPVQKSSDFVDHRPYVPKKDPAFIPWGEYNTIKKIVSSGEFFPVFISGMSGNGKTQMIKHVCAALNRQFIRVQINPDTDEMDLLGSLRLEDGSTTFSDGPVIAAMKSGAVLLLDEIDRGSSKTSMSLQGVLEGESVLIKKTGELVHPAPGFQVIATANTKGRGSLNGRYTAATIVDEAFLERFAVDIEQEFPKKDTVQKILNAFLDNLPSFSKL